MPYQQLGKKSSLCAIFLVQNCPNSSSLFGKASQTVQKKNASTRSGKQTWVSPFLCFWYRLSICSPDSRITVFLPERSIEVIKCTFLPKKTFWKLNLSLFNAAIGSNVHVCWIFWAIKLSFWKAFLKQRQVKEQIEIYINRQQQWRNKC